MDYLKQNTDVRVVYAKQTEIDQKSEDYKLWYKYDTHWNNLGAFVGEQALRQELQGERILYWRILLQRKDVSAAYPLLLLRMILQSLQALESSYRN